MFSILTLVLCIYIMTLTYFCDLFGLPSVLRSLTKQLVQTCDHQGRPKKIMWYGVGNSFQQRLRNDYFVDCECGNCIYEIPIVEDSEILAKNMTGPFEADAILMQGCHLKNLRHPPIRKNADQVFVFVDREPVISIDEYMAQNWMVKHFIDVFNWTFTYRLDSDIFYPYGAIIPKKGMDESTKSIQIGNKNIKFRSNTKSKASVLKRSKNDVEMNESGKEIEVKIGSLREAKATSKRTRNSENSELHPEHRQKELNHIGASKEPLKKYGDIFRSKKRTVAWVVSHCPTLSNRLAFVHEMQEYIDVDIYGACGNLSIAEKIMGASYMDILEKNYKFYLAFENAFETDYVTEKLFDWFERDLIVVVRGAAAYYRFVPKDTIINAADFATPKALAEYLRRLGQDKSRYVGYLSRKSMYRVKERKAIWKQVNCQLCLMLHNVGLYRKSYSHIGKWWKHTH